jgi:hypothetical protein
MYPLPIDIVKFSATATDCDVQLAWQSGVENKLNRYDVQYSGTATDFYTIGSVLPNGNNSNYTYRYTPLQAGRAYFRLKLANGSNALSYSNTLQVTTDCKRLSGSQISIYPNPTNDLCTIAGLKGGETISVFDATGKMVLTRHNTSAEKTEISLGTFASGIYHVVVKDNTDDTQHFNLSKHN